MTAPVRPGNRPAASSGRHAAGSPAPDSPLELGSQGWRVTLRRALREAKADRVPMIAGSLAYHGFLAIFPAMIAFIGVASLVGISPGTRKTLVDGIGKALPKGASGVLTDALSAATQRAGGAAVTATALAVVVGLWSASGGMANLETGLDIAYEVPAERKFVKKRLYAFVLLAVSAIFGGASMVLTVFAAPLGQEISAHQPLSAGVFDVIWTVVRWVVTVMLITVLFAFIYRYGPNRERPSWRWISPGGLFGSGLWLLASLALSFYISAFGKYGKTYGALAGVAIMLLWLYVSSLAVLLGAQINAEVERQAAALGADTGTDPPSDPPAGDLDPAGRPGAVDLRGADRTRPGSDLSGGSRRAAGGLSAPVGRAPVPVGPPLERETGDHRKAKPLLVATAGAFVTGLVAGRASKHSIPLG